MKYNLDGISQRLTNIEGLYLRLDWVKKDRVQCTAFYHTKEGKRLGVALIGPPRKTHTLAMVALYENLKRSKKKLTLY